MRLIATLALTALASTLVVAGDFCDLGPTFWCENRDNAKICSAVEYCDKFVWKIQNAEDAAIGSTRSASCQDCTKFFASLKTFLSTESLTFTQDLIVELLCKTLGQYRQQCEAMTKSYLPSFSNFLISQIDPKTVCKQVQLCQKEEQHQNSVSDDFFSVNWSELSDKNSNGASKICVDCKKFVDAAKNLGKQFQPLIKDLTVKVVCSKLSRSAKVECELIAKILPAALGEALKYIDSTKECTAFRLCSRTSDSASDEDSVDLLRGDNGLSSPLEVIAMKKWNYPQSSKTCTDCQQFFNALVSFLQKETLTYVQDVILEQLCPRTGPFKQQCADLTKNFLPSTLKMLLGMINPKKTCTAMKACTRNTPEEQNDILSDFENHIESIDFEMLADILQQNLSASKCEVCKQTLSFIQTAIKSFRGPLEAILENVVCNFLGPASGPCKMIVKTLFPFIFDALEQVLKDPAKICRFFRICASLEAAIDESFLALDAPQDDLESKLVWSVVEEPTNSDDECLICQRIAQDFENFLKLDETAVCQEFSEQEKSTCVSMVKTFNPALINRLAAAVSPKFFCEKARICPTAKDFGRFNRV